MAGGEADEETSDKPMTPQEHGRDRFRRQVGGEFRRVDLVVEHALGSVHHRMAAAAADAIQGRLGRGRGTRACV